MPVALGADDPLLFGTRLTAQYEIARHAHGFTDAELADLARMSVLVVGRAGAGPGPAAGRHRRLAGRRGITWRGIPAAAARLTVLRRLIRLSPGSPRKKRP